MKTIKKIKWENIITLINVILYTYSIIQHIKFNGLNEMIILEIFIYSMLCLVMRYSIKEIRIESK